jgi:DNA-directed RNA polymerase specialized sigma24 family protein
VPRDVVALVSADDFVSAIRVYADRVNDLLRRRGVPPLEAIEICETHALALLDAVINAPESVIDLAGWWFARANEVTSASPATSAAGDEAISMLAGTEGESRVRAALDTLPDAQRSAVILRDGYDLPPQAVGVALRRGSDSATELTASGRLGLVSAYDARPAPDLAGHNARRLGPRRCAVIWPTARPARTSSRHSLEAGGWPPVCRSSRWTTTLGSP